jgi:hypothetical protein
VLKQPGEGLFIIMPGGLIPDFVRYRVGAVAEPRHGFTESERSAFGIAEVQCVAPCGNSKKALVGFACLSHLASVHVHTEAAAIDLAGTQLH